MWFRIEIGRQHQNGYQHSTRAEALRMATEIIRDQRQAGQPTEDVVEQAGKLVAFIERK